MNHIARICDEFLKLSAERKPWWQGKRFSHPDTGNRVRFKSLPPAEQKRLNALHKDKLDKKKDVEKSKTERIKLKKERAKKRLEKSKAREQRKKDRAKRRKEREKKKLDKAKAFQSMTPESHPNFFTSNGKRLNTTRGMLPGVKVEINPDWDAEKDNHYYAKQINPKTGRPLHYYTEDFIKRHNKIKFANNQRFGQLLPKIRQKYTALLRSKNPRDKAYATAIALVDQGAMRIGNKKSEEDDVRGLHNLQVKHLNLDGDKATFSYVGKKKQDQNHSFNVDGAVKDNLQAMIKGKSPEDPIFTWEKDGEETRIAPKLVNRYLRQKLGSNVTIHHFRHYHGTRMADEYLRGIDVDKITPRQAKRAVREAAVVVSEKLGNTPNVARKHYIDPTVFQMFYQRAGMKPPKIATADAGIKKTAQDELSISSTYGITPDEEEFNARLWETKLEDLESDDA